MSYRWQVNHIMFLCLQLVSVIEDDDNNAEEGETPPVM